MGELRNLRVRPGHRDEGHFAAAQILPTIALVSERPHQSGELARCQPTPMHTLWPTCKTNRLCGQSFPLGETGLSQCIADLSDVGS